MTPLHYLARWPRVATVYVLALTGAYAWWALQSPSVRAAVLAASSTDLDHLQRAPWLVLPASSVWPGSAIAYWAAVVLLCLGALEQLRGALTTVALGIAAHVVGTLVSEGITAIRIAAGEVSGSARHLLDVGPSYAVAACAAAVVASPGAKPWLRVACAMTLVPLVVAAFDVSDESQVAAIGHATAVMLGVLAGRWRSPGRQPAIAPA